MGMLSMLLTGLAALIVFYRIYPHRALLATVLGLSVTAAAGLALLLSRSVHQLVLAWFGPAGESAEPAWRASTRRAIAAMERYRRQPGLLALVLLMSVGVQILRVLQAYLLSEAMALGTPLVYFFCFVPLILLVTMLPISVSGLGTTNLAYVALFGSVGMDPDGAFVLSVLILALGVIGNLPGGIIYSLEGFTASAVPTISNQQTREENSSSMANPQYKIRPNRLERHQ
jgi:hypothetical protein